MTLGLLLGAAALLALFALGLALLTCTPAPSYPMALLSVAVSEKTFVPGLAALAAALLALPALHSRLRILAALVLLLGALALALALRPPLQARAVARARGVSLDVARYLTAPIERDSGHAPITLPYARPGGQSLALDVYPAPADGVSAAARRAVLVIHGGGWSAGDKAETSRSNLWLAAQGFHVFALEYRLAPTARWKEMIGDVKCAVGWIKDHARLRVGDRTLAIDPTRVALLGRSAGGQLALLAGFTSGDAELPSSCGGDESAVDAIIALYAPTDLVWGYANPTRRQVYDSGAKLRGLMGGAPADVGEAYQRASPCFRVHAQVPPVLLVHGDHDQIVSPRHVDFLATRLQALGIYHERLTVPFGQHGFDYIVGGLGGQLTEDAIVKFLTEVDHRKTAAPAR